MRAFSERTGAHHTGLERHDEGAVVEPPATEHAGRVPQGQQLGVGRRVLQALPLVVTSGDDQTVTHDHRTDGDVAVAQGRLGLGQRQLHGRGIVGDGAAGQAEAVGILGHGGGSGIRTHGELPHTRSPGVPIRPLSHPS